MKLFKVEKGTLCEVYYNDSKTKKWITQYDNFFQVEDVVYDPLHEFEKKCIKMKSCNYIFRCTDNHKWKIKVDFRDVKVI